MTVKTIFFIQEGILFFIYIVSRDSIRASRKLGAVQNLQQTNNSFIIFCFYREEGKNLFVFVPFSTSQKSCLLQIFHFVSFYCDQKKELKFSQFLQNEAKKAALRSEKLENLSLRVHRHFILSFQMDQPLSFTVPRWEYLN